MVFVCIIQTSKYIDSARAKVMRELSSQKAFFNQFIDPKRHFLFDSFFPRKYPFKGIMRQIFSEVLLLFLL